MLTRVRTAQHAAWKRTRRLRSARTLEALSARSPAPRPNALLLAKLAYMVSQRGPAEEEEWAAEAANSGAACDRCAAAARVDATLELAALAEGLQEGGGAAASAPHLAARLMERGEPIGSPGTSTMIFNSLASTDPNAVCNGAVGGARRCPGARALRETR